MNNKEAIRLGILTFAGLISGWFGSSGMARSVAGFLRVVASPEVFDRLWELVAGRTGPVASNPPPGVHAGTGEDPFAFLNDLAGNSGAKLAEVQGNRITPGTQAVGTPTQEEGSVARGWPWTHQPARTVGTPTQEEGSAVSVGFQAGDVEYDETAKDLPEQQQPAKRGRPRKNADE